MVCLISGTAIALASIVQLVDPSLPPVVYLIIAAVAAYFGAFRLGRGGILVFDEGVVVRNPFRTTRPMHPAEIEGCVLDTWHRIPDVAFLVLKNGARIPVVMLEVSPLSQFGKDNPVHEAIDDFNAWLAGEHEQRNA